MVDNTGPEFASAEVAANGTTLTVTFDEDLDASSAPAGSAFTVTLTRPSGEAGTISSTATTTISGKTVTVTLSEIVSSDTTLTLGYTKPATNPLQDAAGNDTEDFSGKEVTNSSTTDRLPPVRQSISVNARTLTLTFDEDVDEDSAPAGSAFTVRATMGAGNRSLSGTGTAAVSGKTVTVTLASAVARDETVESSYQPLPCSLLGDCAPSQDPLQDAAGNDVTLFSSVSTTNNSPAAAVSTGVTISSTPPYDADGDDTPETYWLGATIRVQVTFDRAVTVATTDGTPRLKIDLGGTGATGERWADYESGSGTKVPTFAYRVAANDLSTGGVAVLENSLELNGGVITDTADGVEAPLRHVGQGANAGHKVDHRAGAPSLASESPASVDGLTLTLTFNNALDEDSEPAATDFAVTVAGAARDVSGVAVSGATVVLTLASAVEKGETVTVSYTADAAKPVRRADGVGDPAESFTDQAVDNATGQQPVLEDAVVVGATLTLLYDEALDEDLGAGDDGLRGDRGGERARGQRRRRERCDGGADPGLRRDRGPGGHGELHEGRRPDPGHPRQPLRGGGLLREGGRQPHGRHHESEAAERHRAGGDDHADLRRVAGPGPRAADRAFSCA